jgi:hypothetical protein
VLRNRRFLVASVAATLALTLGVTPPAAAADPQPLAGSPYADVYPNGWHSSAIAGDLAFNLLVKHHRTVLRCAPSAFATFFPGVGPLRFLSAARALRMQRYARTGRAVQAQAQTLEVVMTAVRAVAGQGCIAAYNVVRAAYIIRRVGNRSASVYYADRSVFEVRVGFNSCTIDITVGERGRTEARYLSQYRFCGPTW